MRLLVAISSVGLVACGPWDQTPSTPVEEPEDSAPGIRFTNDDVGIYAMEGFSFIDDWVAGMPQPGRRAPLEEDLSFIASRGIRLLVSLTVEPLPAEVVAAHGLESFHLPIEDMHPPSYPQQLRFVEEVQRRVDDGQRVGVHCSAGLGRTGTMLATWLVAGGLSAEEAIDTVRERRPGSIETDDQVAAIHQFAMLWSTR